MAVRRALGTLDPIVYFINKDNMISLPPSTAVARQIKDRMSRKGWELREASTLDQIDRLQELMQRQEYAARQRHAQREEGLYAQARKSVRDRLYSRMTSSGTSAYEREFIQAYLMLADEKRSKYRNRFTADQAFFEAREMDNGHALQDRVDSIAASKDTACVKCGQFRRVQGSDRCARCA